MTSPIFTIYSGNTISEIGTAITRPLQVPNISISPYANLMSGTITITQQDPNYDIIFYASPNFQNTICLDSTLILNNLNAISLSLNTPPPQILILQDITNVKNGCILDATKYKSFRVIPHFDIVCPTGGTILPPSSPPSRGLSTGAIIGIIIGIILFVFIIGGIIFLILRKRKK